VTWQLKIIPVKSVLQNPNGAPSLLSRVVRPQSTLRPRMRYALTQEKLGYKFCGAFSPFNTCKNEIKGDSRTFLRKKKEILNFLLNFAAIPVKHLKG